MFPRQARYSLVSGLGRFAAHHGPDLLSHGGPPSAASPALSWLHQLAGMEHPLCLGTRWYSLLGQVEQMVQPFPLFIIFYHLLSCPLILTKEESGAQRQRVTQILGCKAKGPFWARATTSLWSPFCNAGGARADVVLDWPWPTALALTPASCRPPQLTAWVRGITLFGSVWGMFGADPSKQCTHLSPYLLDVQADCSRSLSSFGSEERDLLWPLLQSSLTVEAWPPLWTAPYGHHRDFLVLTVEAEL